MSQISHDLAVSLASLRTWVKRYEVDAGELEEPGWPGKPDPPYVPVRLLQQGDAASFAWLAVGGSTLFLDTGPETALLVA